MRCAAILVLLAAAAGFTGTSAQAALPGRDGRIAYTSDWLPDDCGEHSCEEEYTGLNTVRPDGTGRRALGHCGRRSQSCEERQAAWSPDGRRIAFVHDDSIWVMRANGSHAHRVSRRAADTPCWSPDGRHIAFTELYAYTGWITIMRPDGSHLRRLTRGHDNSDPSWSVGGLIAYSHYPSGNAPVYVATRRVDGRLVSSLKRPYDVANPDFSPDGKLIAFERWGDDTLSVWVARPDGSHMRLVARMGAFPAWSPSGRSIAYSSPDGPTPTGNAEIFAVRPDGNYAHRVGPASRGPDDRHGDYIQPAWQPRPRR